MDCSTVRLLTSAARCGHSFCEIALAVCMQKNFDARRPGPWGARVSRFLLGGRVLPLGINRRIELAAADQFLKIAGDGASGDAELTSQDRDVRTGPCIADQFQNSILAAETIRGAA